MTDRPNYKIKCEKCGLFIDKELIIFNYGRKTCKECLRTQTVSKTYALYIPYFIIREAGMKPLEQVTIENTPEGIIITKSKKENIE